MELAYVVRPAFDRAFLTRATQDEREVVREHGDWLQARYAEGRVVFAGRCYDGPFGLVVLDAGNEEEARRLMGQDPSIRAGVQRADLYPFHYVSGPRTRPAWLAGTAGQGCGWGWLRTWMRAMLPAGGSWVRRRSVLAACIRLLGVRAAESP